MNVLLSQTHVMLMLTVLILMGVMCAHVKMDTLEMGFHVQVWTHEAQCLKACMWLLFVDINECDIQLNMLSSFLNGWRYSARQTFNHLPCVVEAVPLTPFLIASPMCYIMLEWVCPRPLLSWSV